MRTLLSLGLLFCSVAVAQDISIGSYELASEQLAMMAPTASLDQPYGPASPAQPVGPSQPAGPTMTVALLAPLQPSQPGGPLSPTDPQQPSRSALAGAVVGEAAAVTTNVVTIRVPEQLQNVSVALNNLFRNLAAAGQ